jgi:hypothetical protein
MEAFSKLDCATVGRGPRHPTAPDESNRACIASFIDNNPYLRRYPDYIEFLECYGGAVLDYPDDHPVREFLLLFGFDDFVHAADPVDSEGFYIFCTATSLHNMSHDRECAFYFDATAKRPIGVYGQLVDCDKPNHGDREHYCPTFLEWLEELVDRKGRPVLTQRRPSTR